MPTERMPKDLRALLRDLRSCDVLEDPAGFLRFRERLRQRVQRQLPAGDRLRTTLDSEDLTQDVLVRLVEAVHEFRGETWEEFAGFVQTVLQRRRIDLSRRSRRDAERHDEFRLAEQGEALRTDTPSVILAGKEDRQRLRRMIDQLPSSLSSALLARMSGRSFEQVAEALGISQANARQRVSRAIRMLRERWSGSGA